MMGNGKRVRSRGSVRARALVRATGVAVLVLASRGAIASERAQLELRLPPDAVYQRVVGPDSAVVFRHGTHIALFRDRCVACHPRLFRILAPTTRLSHVEMNAGRSCGACHDGVRAFGVRDPRSCPACHVGRSAIAARAPRPGAADAAAPAVRGPGPITYAASPASPGPVTFQHSTHARRGCAACHPGRFAMASNTSRAREDMHEYGTCGGCHDGKRAFAVNDPESCGRCHGRKAATP